MSYGGSGFKKGYPVPYYSRLHDTFEPGQTVTVKGLVHEEPHLPITVNFKDESGNIAFHMSVRFDEKKVVFNHFNNGKWSDKEVRKSVPFEKAGPFDVRVRAHQDKFEIDCLGKNFHEFEYAIPLHSITQLEVDGSVILSHVSWGGRYYSVPYEANVKGGLPPGKQVTITGTPDKKAHEFSVSMLHEGGDIALRVRPSFKDKKVYRNSYQDGKWQNEEKETQVDFPFTKEVQFDIVIVNTAYKFEIWINGDPYATFAHRMDPKQVAGLKIEGDVEISGISASRD